MKVRYPHMFGAESAIWNAWLKKFEYKYDRYLYDVHVGKLWPEHTKLERRWRTGAEAVYRKRIDVVGFRADEICIFEVKPHAGMGALGQIIGYVSLYDQEFNPRERISGAIVAELIDPNIRQLLEDHGIEYYVVSRQ